MSLISTPRTWVAAEVVTAAELNAEIRDAITGVEAAWTTFTPTWTAVTTNPALVNGTMLGHYRQVGRTVEFIIQITMGSSTTFGTGAWILSLPVAENANFLWTFQGLARDVSAAQNFPVTPIDLSAGTIQVACDPITAGATLRSVSGTVPFTWAVGDVLFISGAYEAA